MEKNMKDYQSLTDEEFFDLYCKRADVVFNNGENQMVFIKNKEHRIIYLSFGYMHNLNIPSIEDTYGENAPVEQEEYYKDQNNTAIVQDNEIQTTLQPKNFLFIDEYQHINHIHKRPIINPATGNYVGLIGYISHFALPNILRLIYRINGIINENTHETHEALSHELTERQQMVLFLYLNRYSNAEISDIMTTIDHKLSKSRVNDYLENLKYIFNVKSKVELIEKAIQMKYHLIIPRSFLKPGSYHINDELVVVR